MPPDTTNTEIDTALPATTAEAAAVDTAAEAAKTAEPKASPEAEAIHAALRTDDDGKPLEGATDEGADQKAADTKAATDKAATDAAAGAAAAAEAKSILDEETPEFIKGRSRESFDRLKAESRTIRDQLAQKDTDLQALIPAAQEWDKFATTMHDTGATQEDIVAALQVVGSIVKGTPDQKRQSLAVVEQLRERLAGDLGLVLPGIDLLAGHPDLAQKVRDGDIDQEVALELAAGRKRGQTADQRETQRLAQEAEQRQRQASTDAEQVATQQASATITSLATQLQARDGLAYEPRVLYAMQQAKRVAAEVGANGGQVKPERLVQLFQTAYAECPQSLVDAHMVAKRGATRTGASPHMGTVSGANGAATREIKTTADAVHEALHGTGG